MNQIPFRFMSHDELLAACEEVYTKDDVDAELLDALIYELEFRRDVYLRERRRRRAKDKRERTVQ